MNFAFIIRIFILIMGIAIMLWNITSLAKKRLTETFSLFWGLLAIIFIILAIVIRPVMLNAYFRPAGLVLIILAVICVIGGMCFISVKLSELARRNIELAIDVSLLHEQCDELKKQVDGLKGNVEKTGEAAASTDKTDRAL